MLSVKLNDTFTFAAVFDEIALIYLLWPAIIILSPTCKSSKKTVFVPVICTVLFKTFAVPVIAGGPIVIFVTAPLAATVETYADAPTP